MLVVFKWNEKIAHRQPYPKFLINDVEHYKDFFVSYEDEWFTADELIVYLNLKHYTNVISVINYLRIHENLPIISSNLGYKLTYNKEELIKYYDVQHHRALATLATAKVIKNHIYNSEQERT